MSGRRGKALADDPLTGLRLRQESYQRFKSIGLEDKTIVGGAHYFKRNGGDMNEASKASRDVHNGLAPVRARAITAGAVWA